MKTLEGVNAWNRSCDLAIRTYQSIEACSNASFRDRLTETSLAVASHIAEGYELDSPDQFSMRLKNARAYCAELRTQLHVAGELGLVDSARSSELIAHSLEISSLLVHMIDWCEEISDNDATNASPV